MTTRYFLVWVPYVIAACLTVVGIEQAHRILEFKTQLKADDAEVARLTRSDALIGLRVISLEPRDASYLASKILVAWDPNQFRGIVNTQNLPEPATGHNYQLWVLDPGAQTPINAGVIQLKAGSRLFTVQSLSTASPGFAVSLEPAGTSTPTGTILFAVPPGQ